MTHSMRTVRDEAANAVLKWKVTTRSDLQEDVEWPTKALTAGSKNVTMVLYQTEFTLPAGTDVQATLDNWKALYAAAAEKKDKGDHAGFFSDLRSLSLPLRLDPAVDLGQAVVQFAIRGPRAPLRYDLMVFLSKLPSLSCSSVQKLAPTMN
jgi:hypothetical protein